LTGSFITGNYRNLFSQFGHADAEIENKLEQTWQALFYGDGETRIHYPAGADTAYILDTGNNDVRTEGMSYGMMMCVQMDKQTEFDRIWKWTYENMRQTQGKYKGYFAWSAHLDGTKRAQGPAPDGEEYFAMALFFASHRWGEGEPPFDYAGQARQILRECVHKGEAGGLGDPMWNTENKLIKFVPESKFSDPSYHLPHFYELFSLWGNPEDRSFWKEAADESRKYLVKACHPVTGLAPEYAEFDASPHADQERDLFFSDAYRVAGNIGLDYEWFGPLEDERIIANHIQNFFVDKELCAKYSLDGRPVGESLYYHPNGLLAMNAMASLAADNANVESYVNRVWGLPLRTGIRRYYDNCLHFFSLLALSGRYRIW
jgi:oligosaccharide reducing-end xylanase